MGQNPDSEGVRGTMKATEQSSTLGKDKCPLSQHSGFTFHPKHLGRVKKRHFGAKNPTCLNEIALKFVLCKKSKI